MKTELEILNKIIEIKADIKEFNELKIINTDYADNIILTAAISSAKKQIQLLKWVLNYGKTEK